MKTTLSLPTAYHLPLLAACYSPEELYDYISGLSPAEAAVILVDWGLETADEELARQARFALSLALRDVPQGQRNDYGRSEILELAEEYAPAIVRELPIMWPREVLEPLADFGGLEVLLDRGVPRVPVVVCQEPPKCYAREQDALNDALSHRGISVRSIASSLLVLCLAEGHESLSELPITRNGVVDRPRLIDVDLEGDDFVPPEDVELDCRYQWGVGQR